VLKLTRKTEYALLALRGLGRDPEGLQSVRHIAEHYNLPETLLSKVLQRLKSGGLVESVKGAAGGYRLAKAHSEILLMDVLTLFAEQTHLVDCMSDEASCRCEQLSHCDIRQPLETLNALLVAQLTGLNLSAFVHAGPGWKSHGSLSIHRSMEQSSSN
jgi:Rrf2 family protein